MDGIFGALIWLIIIFIWIFSFLKKTRREDSESREKTPSELEKNILETLGISFPEIPEPDNQRPSEPKPSGPKIEEKIHYPQGIGLPVPLTLKGRPSYPLRKGLKEGPYIEKKKESKAPREVPKPAVTTVIVEETERGFPDLLTAEKLQEGIIFSVILGPPKAYRFLGFYSKKPS